MKKKKLFVILIKRNKNNQSASFIREHFCFTKITRKVNHDMFIMSPPPSNTHWFYHFGVDLVFNIAPIHNKREYWKNNTRGRPQHISKLKLILF